MGWRMAKSVEDLKRLGKIKTVSKMISKELGGINVPQKSWKKLLNFIQSKVSSYEVPRMEIEEEGSVIEMEEAVVPDNERQAETVAPNTLLKLKEQDTAITDIIQTQQEIEIMEQEEGNPSLKEIENLSENSRWWEVNTLEELKALGTYTQVRKQVSEAIITRKITANGWNELWQIVQTYQKEEETTYSSHYFKDKASEILFYLLELEGEARLKRLGITRGHFIDKDYAEEWLKETIEYIHSDRCNHPFCKEGTIELNNIYEQLVRYSQ